MRENPSHRQYKKFLLLELNPGFNRFDIIDRVGEICSNHLSNLDVRILVFSRKENSYIIVNPVDGTHISGSLWELLINGLEACNQLVILTEDGEFNVNLIRSADCYLAGLHSDIPMSVIDFIVRRFGGQCIRLSRIPYLASQVLLIIDSILETESSILNVLSM